MDYSKRCMVCVSLEQLVPNLCDKTRYVLHSRKLHLYVQVGMRLKIIHGALRFDQRPRMESYIQKNTEF